jgi:predicted sugar kinase
MDDKIKKELNEKYRKEFDYDIERKNYFSAHTNILLLSIELVKEENELSPTYDNKLQIAINKVIKKFVGFRFDILIKLLIAVTVYEVYKYKFK